MIKYKKKRNKVKIIIDSILLCIFIYLFYNMIDSYIDVNASSKELGWWSFWVIFMCFVDTNHRCASLMAERKNNVFM